MMMGIVFGIITGWLCWWALSVSFFIRELESGENCEQCKMSVDCFARKKALWSKYTVLDQWILLAFCKVISNCSFVRKSKLRYLIISILSTILLMMLFFWSKTVSMKVILYGISISMLCMLSVVDWNTQYIPLECNIIIFICGLIHLFADFSNWGDYLIGLIAVSGFLFLVDRIATPVLAKRYSEEEMDSVIGDGDIKLMAATGLLLGWKLNFLALGIGCISGSVIHLIRMKIKESETRLALGPYLSLGVYITMICGEQLVSWYLDMMGYIPYQ